MEITKLEKCANYNCDKLTITVEITIPSADLIDFDYTGLDMLPDESIPDLLVALGRMYKGKIKNGKIAKEKVASILYKDS